MLPRVDGAVVAVAVSGGRDSIALLYATLKQAGALGFRVAALHVHHGLQADADQWLARLQARCRRWAVAGAPLDFLHRRLSGRPAAGESIEAWARRERYAALAHMASEAGATLVLLAHHRRDQAETFLLQALRGAGAAGLSAMPREIERGAITWARPWLDQPREAVEAYGRRHRLKFVDDPSNGEGRFARNRLRLDVWPALATAFHDAETALAGAAARAQQESEALRELAVIDLATVVAWLDEGNGRRDGPRQVAQHATTATATATAATATTATTATTARTGQAVDLAELLHIERWLALSPARRANALRHWLQDRLPSGASDSLIHRLQAELPARSTPARWLVHGGELRRYRGLLAWAPAASTARHGPVDAVARSAGTHSDCDAAGAGRLVESASEPTPQAVANMRIANIGDAVTLCVARAGAYPLPAWRGVLHADDVSEGGIALSRLASVQLQPRRGAEQFQSRPGGIARSLKKQYQSAGLPAWERSGPLVCCDGALLFVPGLGVDARALAPPGVPQLMLRWLPHT